MTKVICLCGGPGVGKSTVATGLFSALKQRKVSCEYVSEYAKEVVWEGTHKLLENQIHIFAEQFRRQFRLLGKVDYIVTDSPLILSSVYFRDYLFSLRHEGPQAAFFDKPMGNETTVSAQISSGTGFYVGSASPLPTTYVDLMTKFMDTSFAQFDNMIYFLRRAKDYNPSGRMQTLDEAKILDQKISQKLYLTGNFPSELLGTDEENIQSILKDIFEKVEAPRIKTELVDDYTDNLRNRWLDGQHIHVKLTPVIEKEDN